MKHPLQTNLAEKSNMHLGLVRLLHVRSVARVLTVMVMVTTPLAAEVVLTGDVTPTLPWEAFTEAYIGELGPGALTVDGGSSLESSYAYLGYAPGSSGVASITGTGSTWSNHQQLWIGYSGSGAVLVESEGKLNSTRAYLGYEVGSTGGVTISGPSSTWTNTENLFVGFDSGSGTLAVENGGHVNAGTLYASLADLQGNGSINATGAVLDGELQFGSELGTTAYVDFGTGGVLTVTPGSSTSLGVGYKGLGSLLVEDGIAVSSQFGFLGFFPGSVGSATVTGSGSSWTTTSTLVIGNFGNGNLRVESGGHVASSDGSLGGSLDSTSVATITGSGSIWTNNGPLNVGLQGSGELRIEAGAQVTNTDGNIGYYAGAVGLATVTGPGSVWTNSGRLTLGVEGNGTLVVENGGHVNAKTIFSSVDDLQGNGTISASGAILDGVLQFNSTHGASALVNFGSGGVLTVTPGPGDLGVGYRGAGQLQISEGIAVTSVNGVLGQLRNSAGTALVTGVGSQWTNSGVLRIGHSGSGMLRVEAGGQVGNTSGYLGGFEGAGAATVTGVGSQWVNTSSLMIGDGGSGILRVEAGGEVSNTQGYVGNSFRASGAAIVTGTGSKWKNTSSLTIGNLGPGSLRVEGGGEVLNTIGYIGNESVGEVRVSGMDSMWTNSNSLTIGRRQGGSGSLRVSQGGQVSNTSAFVGSEAGSVGTVHVSGIGSTWTNSGILYLGYAGSGTLRVESGGKVAMQSGFLGYHSGSIGTATISGSGSSLSNLNSYLHIGLNGIGILRVEQGGNVNNTFARLGWGPGSIGTATVSGSGSVWENESSLDVGLRGLGTLRVEKGGRVESLTGQLGVDWEGTGTVTITGAGSAWRNQLSLYVGSSGSGTLTIDNGGLVSVGGPLTIDYNGGMDSFINMATGGMLALWGDADNSLQQFLALVSGTDAIRYWDNSLDTWEPLVNATYGDDYTLKYLTTGDLAGYTLLTVGTMTSGDYDHDGDVDGRDFLQWQRRHPLLIDLSVWQSTYANGTLGSMASVPEPTLTTYLLGLLLLPHRLGHRRGRSCIFSGLRTHIRSLS